MNVKRILLIITISIVMVILLMYFIYDLDMRLIYISDVFFFVGIVYFFLGIIAVTGATEIFSSAGYLSRKAFSKDKSEEGDFKSFSDYKEYKKYKNLNDNSKSTGLGILSIGGVYILISLVISMII